MKTVTSMAFALVLGATAIPAVAVVAPVTMTAAQACNVQMGRPNSCHQGYLESCRQYGYKGPCGLGGQRAGHSGGYMQGRPMARPMYQGQPRGYAPKRPVVIVRESSGGYYRGSSVARSVAAPVPTVVQARQPTEAQITRVRVPCAEGWQLMPNGNCGRWVQ